MPKHKCDKCKDSGYVLIVRDGHDYARECSCGLVERLRQQSKLKFANVPKEFSEKRLSDFRLDVYQNQMLSGMAKKVATNYVERFESLKDKGKGLYFYSETKGSGKSMMALCMANELMERYGAVVKFATTTQLLSAIKATWNGEGLSEQELIHDIIQIQVLILDDIGIEGSKDWVNERFYEILNGRMLENKITFFTSNCRVEELHLDERIKNRIAKMAVPVQFPAESIRLKLAQEENDALFEELLGIPM